MSPYADAKEDSGCPELRRPFRHSTRPKRGRGLMRYFAAWKPESVYNITLGLLTGNPA